jgi:hypothetical protein
MQHLVTRCSKMSNTKNPWSEQEIKQVSAESMVDVRTIKRTLAGEAVREVSRARILYAARRLKLRLPLTLLSVLWLIGCGGPSFTDLGGAPDAGGTAGAAGQAGAAGTAGTAGAVADSGECASGDTRPCSCIGVAGEQSCDKTSWGVCKETQGWACCSQPGQWLGCYTDGCSVCTDELIGFPHYFEHHPNCDATSCEPTQRGACNEACPAPTADDQ